MATMLKTGKTVTVSRAEDLSAGTLKRFPNPSQPLAFGNATYTPSEVTSKLKEISDLRTATTDAQSAAKAKVAAEKAQLPALLLFMAAYVAFVKATFGNAPDILADFGLQPKKARKPLTAEKLAAAKAKHEATRAARGTVGSVKKKAIVGNVVGVTVTPVTAPAVPSAQPAPGPTTHPA